MTNMSYCRFENTFADLADCVMKLEEMVNEEHFNLSQSEKEYANRMRALCREYLDIYEVLKELEDE